MRNKSTLQVTMTAARTSMIVSPNCWGRCLACASALHPVATRVLTRIDGDDTGREIYEVRCIPCARTAGKVER